MRDMQRERLKHLMTSAILELWKKETGSVSPVVIEGTICITSGSGKTTVVQVADKFLGSIHGSSEDNKDRYNGASPGSYLGHVKGIHPAFSAAVTPVSQSNGLDKGVATPRVDLTTPLRLEGVGPRVDGVVPTRATPVGHPAYLDHLSPGSSLLSPGATDSSSRCSLRSLDTASDRTSPTDKDSELGKVNGMGFYRENKTRTEFEHKLRRSRTRSRSRSVERQRSEDRYTGSSRETLETCNSEPSVCRKGTEGESRRDSGIGDSAENLALNATNDDSRRQNSIDGGDDSSRDEDTLEISGNHLKTSTPRNHAAPGEDDCSDDADAMDLSSSAITPRVPRPNAEDLALSPPSSYTAQVRDVIRQRILAAGKTNGSAFEPVIPEVDSGSVTGSEGKMENDANNNEPDATPKIKHSTMQPKRLDRQISGDIGLPPQRERPLSTPPEPLSLVMDPRDLRGFSRSTSLMSPVLAGDTSALAQNSMARSLALQMGMHPSPLAVMASHNFNFFHQATALMDGKSPYSLPVPPLLRPGGGPANNRGLSPVGMYPLPSPHPSLPSPHPSLPSPLPSPGGSTRDSSGSPTDLNVDDDGRDTGPNGEQRTYRCEYCSKNFLFKSKYHEHLPVHTNARPFRCHLCARTYKYKYDLRVHLRTHMGIPTKSTVCPFCNGKFDTNKQLRAHIKESHKDKQKATEVECTTPMDHLPPAL